jgi:vitamin B12 transporter
MLKRIVFLLVLLFSTPSQGSADQTELPELVVTASKWDESQAEVTQDITVISQAEIRRRKMPFVVDLLRYQPDLNVVQSGGFGKHATVFLRGGDGKQTLVMIDGVKINSPSSGSADLSNILADDVERIEILKGPQSTMYGSEAMSGVVNIITIKGAGKPKVGLFAQGGSFNTVNLWGSLSGGTKKWDYRLTPSFFDTSGISAAASGTEPDGYTQGAASARLGIVPTENSSVDLNMRYSHDRNELDGFEYGVGMVDDPNWIQKRDSYLFSVKGSILPFHNYGQTLLLSYVGDRTKFDDSDTFFNNSRINTDIYNVDWQHILQLAPLRLTAGFSYRDEAAENVGQYDQSADNTACYLDGKIKLLDEALIIDAGVRYDSHETFGEAVTYRTGLLYYMVPWGVRLKVNNGTGFRAPSLNELYYPFYGNENLKAERSTEVDAGIEKEFAGGKFVIGGTWFWQRYNDLIQTNFATFTADNIGKARVEGVEATLAVRPIESLALKAAYTYMDPIDLDTGQILSRRPRNKIVTSVDYTGEKLAIGGDFIFVSKRFDSAVDQYLGSYSLFNLRGSYAVLRHLKVFAKIDNLFDKDYEEAGGFGAPGIAAYGGIQIQF